MGLRIDQKPKKFAKCADTIFFIGYDPRASRNGKMKLYTDIYPDFIRIFFKSSDFSGLNYIFSQNAKG